MLPTSPTIGAMQIKTTWFFLLSKRSSLSKQLINSFHCLWGNHRNAHRNIGEAALPLFLRSYKHLCWVFFFMDALVTHLFYSLRSVKCQECPSRNVLAQRLLKSYIFLLLNFPTIHRPHLNCSDPKLPFLFCSLSLWTKIVTFSKKNLYTALRFLGSWTVSRTTKLPWISLEERIASNTVKQKIESAQ